MHVGGDCLTFNVVSTGYLFQNLKWCHVPGTFLYDGDIRSSTIVSNSYSQWNSTQKAQKPKHYVLELMVTMI